MLRSIVVNLLSSINGTQSAPQAASPLVSFMATSPLDSSLTCPCVCVCLSQVGVLSKWMESHFMGFPFPLGIAFPWSSLAMTKRGKVKVNGA